MDVFLDAPRPRQGPTHKSCHLPILFFTLNEVCVCGCVCVWPCAVIVLILWCLFHAYSLLLYISALMFLPRRASWSACLGTGHLDYMTLVTPTQLFSSYPSIIATEIMPVFDQYFIPGTNQKSRLCVTAETNACERASIRRSRVGQLSRWQ